MQGIVLFFLTLIVLLLIPLFLPFRYRIDAGIRSAFSFSLRAKIVPLVGFSVEYATMKLQGRLLFLGRSFCFSLGGKKKTKAKQEKKKKEKRSRASFSFSDLATFASLFLDVFSRVRPRWFLLEGRLGLADPHLTGYLLAMMGILQTQRGVTLKVYPLWEEELCDLDLQIEGRLTPILLLLVILRHVVRKYVRVGKEKFSRLQLKRGLLGSR